jgi:polyhydroxyalkanoate synthase
MSPRDPYAVSSWVQLAADWQKAWQGFASWWFAPAAALRQSAKPDGGAYDPTAVADLQADFNARLRALWGSVRHAPAHHAKVPHLVEAAAHDRRFKGKAWREIPYFALLKQAYLLYADYMTRLADVAELPPEEKQRLKFMTRQYLDALAPTNFPGTNPEVITRAMETDGESLVEGMRNLAADMQKGRITMTDESAFAIGKNIAVTPGSVVFRNDLIELIQYDATTPSVYKRPLLIVPPCINKYYILDLRPENSFVRHAVAQGHTTFIVSWRNIPEELGGKTWDDYVEEGVFAALKAVQSISGSKRVNTLGFCVGGTILACALAVLAERKDPSAASATFLTTMLDFTDPGEIGVFVSREYLASREAAWLSGTRVPGSELAGAFASLRANDLVWNYVVANYLEGKTPPAFDLLFWNSDSANLAGPMFAYYLKNMYLDNRLREPDALTMLETPIDLSRVVVPTYVLAAREDHIVPWRSAYKTTSLVGGQPDFVLAASGHIAGVVNAPQPPKRNYWTNELLTDDADEWFARAQSLPGSWWTHWYEWLAPHAGAKRPAPKATGNAEFPPLDPAPGRYVIEPS